MKQKQWFIKSDANYQLFVQQWLPEHEEVEAMVCLLHGSGEHSGRYEHVVEALIAANYGVVAYDHYGHGKSDGIRGDMVSFAACMSDVALVCHYAKQLYPNRPMYLYGHSMGGNIALNAALREALPINGLILTSPWLQLAFSPSPFKVWLGKKIANIMPTLKQSTGLKTEDLNRSGFRPLRGDHDPLLHTTVTVRAFVELEESAEWALNNGKLLQVPLLLLHGDADRITSFQASVKLKELLGEQCTFTAYSGGYHELHNDTEGARAIKQIIDWIGQPR